VDKGYALDLQSIKNLIIDAVDPGMDLPFFVLGEKIIGRGRRCGLCLGHRELVLQ
jgi:hypothetical protein